MAQQMTTRSFVVPTVSLTTLLLWIHLPLFAQAWQNPKELWQASATGTNASLRGLELCADGRTVWTCGSQSTVLRSNDLGQTWHDSLCPIPSGEASGVFSIASVPSGRLVAVGGDYRPDQHSPYKAAYSDDAGKTWHLSAVQPNAFRSSVVVLTTAEGSSDTEGSSDIEGSSQFWVATGPSGTDISPDGEHWVNGSTQGFHALASHPNGTLIAVGSEGRFGRTNAQVIRRTMEPSR
jgi:photosystem II stability/assembly factor-like uncharacterized protein